MVVLEHRWTNVGKLVSLLIAFSADVPEFTAIKVSFE